jgi:hypothetical protein
MQSSSLFGADLYFGKPVINRGSTPLASKCFEMKHLHGKTWINDNKSDREK